MNELNKPHLARKAFLWNDEPEIHGTKSIDLGHGVSKTEPDSPVRTRPYCEKDEMGRFDNGLRQTSTRLRSPSRPRTPLSVPGFPVLGRPGAGRLVQRAILNRALGQI